MNRQQGTFLTIVAVGLGPSMLAAAAEDYGWWGPSLRSVVGLFAVFCVTLSIFGLVGAIMRHTP